MQLILEKRQQLSIANLFTRKVSIASLVTFRVLFGLMMLFSIVRFAAKGWIKTLYIDPVYFFTYYGFDWVKPLGNPGMHWLFAFMGIAALGIMLGAFYRISATLFFLTFTYVELIDKSNYLNHYYFVSLVAFLMIFLPAHTNFSIDVWRKPSIKKEKIVAWLRWVIPLQLAFVYFFAGLAKLNPEWLFEALPLKIWLPSRSDLPLIGNWLTQEWLAFAFSWFGAIYDLSIVFFLLYRKTRIWAYMAVVLFHVMTAILFQIGMFPYIMIASTLVFFPDKYHEKAISFISSLWTKNRNSEENTTITLRQNNGAIIHNWKLKLIAIFFVIQLLLPFRYLLYPGELFWTEQGYRFSWRVMLMEKAGYSIFHIKDNETGMEWEASNLDYLTPNQEKMMSTQPDMILQFAHFLSSEYKNEGYKDISVFAESYVALNGRKSRLFINPDIDLTQIEEGFGHKTWILPFSE